MDSPPEAVPLSYHTGTSPIPNTEQLKSLGRSTISTTPIDERPTGLSRALQSLLIAPPKNSAGTCPPRARGIRSPVEPLVSSPLRISYSDMASAPSSPERTRAVREALPRSSSDHAAETGRPSSRLGTDGDARFEVSASPSEQSHSKKRFLQARDKSQGRKGMAAMMSGLESRLFPRSFSRGRDSSRGSIQRGSSLDSRSSTSPERGRPSSSGSHSIHVESIQPAPNSTGKGKTVHIHDHLNKSDEALPNSSGSLPDYVKPAAEENGERLAKDVFDRDKNIIESSEDEGDDTSSDDDSTNEGMRGRKKRADITSITPDDFEKSKNEEPKPAERMLLFQSC